MTVYWLFLLSLLSGVCTWNEVVPPFILPAHAAASGLLHQREVRHSVSHPEDKVFKNICLSFGDSCSPNLPRQIPLPCRDTYREWHSRLAACSFAFTLQQPQSLLVCECRGVCVFLSFYLMSEFCFHNGACLDIWTFSERVTCCFYFIW